MIKKPMKQKPGFLSFMSPLATEVWAAVGAIFLAVSLVLFSVHRWSKSGWRSIRRSTSVKQYVNDFTLGNSLWFTLGSLLRAGNVTVPRYIPSSIQKCLLIIDVVQTAPLFTRIYDRGTLNKLNHERRHRPNNKISFVVFSDFPLSLNWKLKYLQNERSNII